MEYDLVLKPLVTLLTPTLTGLGQVLKSKVMKYGADGGTADQRFAAYEDLRRSCVELRTVLDVLWSLPLDLVGVLISLPLRFRLIHQIPPLGAALNDAFLGVAVVGRREVLQSTKDLAEALQATLQEHGRTAGSSRRRRQRQGRTDPRSADGHSRVTDSEFSGVGRAVILRVGVGCRPVCPAFPLGFLARACGGGWSGGSDRGWWPECCGVERVELVFPGPVTG